jgi:hypothetical protein
MESPQKLLHGEPPTLFNLKVFGCLCYATTINPNRNKLYPRAHKTVFLCFQKETKGYIILDLDRQNISLCRNAISYENDFSYRSMQPSHDAYDQNMSSKHDFLKTFVVDRN